MTKETIVKIQKALFPPDGPALIYNEPRTVMIHEPFTRLPPEIRTALAESGKVYWKVRLIGADLIYSGRAEHQSW